MKKAVQHIDKRILSVFTLGIISGLPWVIMGSALTLWLKESGVSRAQIGFAGLIFVVHAINFFWAPLIDRYKPPIAGLHKRKAWIVCCQSLMLVACLSMHFVDPRTQLLLLILLALCVAVLSATQDIAIDAYRIDSFDKKETQSISYAAGAATAGWWTGYAGLGFVPLYLSDHGWLWPDIYYLLGGMIALSLCLCTLLPKPLYSESCTIGASESSKYLIISANQSRVRKLAFALLVFSPLLLTLWAALGSYGVPQAISSANFYTPLLIVIGIALAGLAALTLLIQVRTAVSTAPASYSSVDQIIAGILESFCEPIRQFFSTTEFRLAIKILLFIFLFKIGEAFLGRMSIVFYKEVGFSNTDIASYSKILTWWVTILAALVAAYVNSKFGLLRGLFVSGVFMAASNLMFSWIALTGPSIPLFIATVIVDGIAAAWSLVAFVAFISALCNHSFSASQYALFASLGNLGRTTLASFSGVFVDITGGNWALFFVMTALMVIPSLVLLWQIRQELGSSSVFKREL